MSEHLGHGKNEPVENSDGNTSNGKSKKTLKGEFGALPIEIPGDRHGTFEPQLINATDQVELPSIAFVVAQMGYLNVISMQRRSGLIWQHGVNVGVSDSTNRRNRCKLAPFVTACRWPP
jgi:transposase-like protein